MNITEYLDKIKERKIEKDTSQSILNNAVSLSQGGNGAFMGCK